jgi:predicted nucleotidyltransferase
MTKFCFDLKKEYKGNLSWLYNRTIFLTVVGSHSYGTNIEGSDVDVKGVCIPPKEIILGFDQNFEQSDQIDPDLVIYGLRKFMFLAANCNPNIIELLFTDPKFHLIKTEVGQKLLDHRDLFLSKRAKHTFSGYAISQLKRMRTHRAWLLDPPKKRPQRADFGLEEGKKVSSSVQGAFNSLLEKGASFDGEVMQLLDREKKYNTAVNHWKQYENWKNTRNPARATLEAKHGYDVKHAMHLIRLMRMCREIITTGKVEVLRSDAQELIAIRNGAWSYEQLINWAEIQDKELDELYKISDILPHQPDRKKLNKLCIELVEELL